MKRTASRAWAALLRVPNLPTVPGDPLAGACLAMADGAPPGPLPWGVAAAAVCLYAAGLIDNDLADIKEDAAARPDRPLPSRRISLPQACIARGALFAAGLILAATEGMRSLSVAFALLLLLLAYNHVLKRARAAGPSAMGLCRGLSLLMGAAAVSPDVLGGGRTIAGFAVLTAAIASITALARAECAIPGRSATIGRMIGFLPILQAVFVLASGHPSSPWLASALAVLAILSAALRRSVAAS